MVPMDRRLFWASLIVVITLFSVVFVKSGLEPFNGMAIKETYADILIVKNGFSPSEILVFPGDTVTWKNTISSSSVLYSPSDNAPFTSNVLRERDSFSHRFDKPGTFTYVNLNSGSKGVVIVKEPKPKAYLEGCAACESGCYNSFDDCTKCTCSCYKDSNCDDNDPGTVDFCSTEPNECVNKQKPSFASGLECTIEGSTALINGNVAACSGNIWQKKDLSREKAVSVIIVGGLLMAGAAYLLLHVKHKPGQNVKKKKR